MTKKESRKWAFNVKVNVQVRRTKQAHRSHRMYKELGRKGKLVQGSSIKKNEGRVERRPEGKDKNAR